jgi:phytoene dehydrogenase-like protein
MVAPMVTTDARSADVIVAGGGHNGLVAACYLAKAGLDVLVVEAHATAGGMTATNPMAPEAPDHLINEASIHASLFRTTSIDAELGLSARHGLRMRPIDPAHVHLGPEGESIAMWRDPARTASEIRRFSKKDADAYVELCRIIRAAVGIGIPMMQTSPTRPSPKVLAKVLREMARGRRELGEIARWVVASQQEVIEDWFEHDMVRGPLTTNLPFMQFDADLSGWSLIYLGVLEKVGVAMFEGGTGAFPASLIRCLQSHGGRVRTSAPVEQILVDATGRATGVRLAGGEEITARRAVVTAFSPKTVLTRLLPAGTLSHRMLNTAKRIPTKNTGMTDFKLNIALKGKLRMTRHQKWRDDDIDLRLPCTTWNTHQQALDAAFDCVQGRVPKMIPGLSQITTAFDPSMAPEGHDTFWYWTGLTPADPIDGWDVARDQIADLVAKDAAQYFEGLDEFEIARRPLAQPDIEERFWAIDGNVYHVDPTITRFGPLKPAMGLAGYDTPVPGLFLTGSGTHPVAGISGMPGQNCARRVLQVLRKQDKLGPGQRSAMDAAHADAARVVSVNGDGAGDPAPAAQLP